MDQTTEPTTPLLVPEPTVAFDARFFPKSAIVNATLRRGHDYLAGVFLSERYGILTSAPEYWQLYPMGGSDGRQTIELFPDCFYRARLGGKHLGIYVDTQGRINCLPERVFVRELNQRFRDCITNVSLSSDESDWVGDRFSRQLPEQNLGEAPFTL